MSSVQQKPDSQLTAEAALDQHDLSTAASSTHVQAPLDLEEVPQGNLEIEEVVRAEREHARRTAQPERELPREFTVEEDIDPATLVNHDQEKILAEKFSALEREADKLRARALEEQVERIPGKKLHIAPDHTVETEPFINRRRAQPSLNLQVKAEPQIKAAPARTETNAPENSARPMIERPRSSQVRQPGPPPRTEPKSPETQTAQRREDPRAAQQPIIPAAPRQPAPPRATAQQPIARQTESTRTATAEPEIVRHNRRPEAARPIVREPAPQQQPTPAKEPALTPTRPAARETELKMQVRQDEGITLEQALKLDLSRAKIGTGVNTKQIQFRGHSIGSGTMLDRLITAIADFIKKLEMRAFSFLDRKRMERKTVKIKLPETEELEGDGLHLQSFSSSLSKERRKRRRIFSRFRK